MGRQATEMIVFSTTYIWRRAPPRKGQNATIFLAMYSTGREMQATIAGLGFGIRELSELSWPTLLSGGLHK